jgi:hypothetical protein
MASTDHQRWIWRKGLALVFLLALAVVPAQAQKFKVLHTFHTGDGPQGPEGTVDPGFGRQSVRCRFRWQEDVLV